VYSNWHPTFMDNQSRGIQNGVLFSHSGQTYKGSHAMTIVGYDDNRAYISGTVTNHGAFLVANQWGQSWGTYNSSGTGTRGFMWVAYDYFKANNGAFGIAFYNDDRPRYRPKLYAIAGLTHAQRGRVSFDGGVRSAGSQVWECHYPDDYPIDQDGGNSFALSDSRRIAVDLTDGIPFISDYGNIQLFAKCMVSSSATTTGIITSADFYHDFDGDGTFQHLTSSTPPVTVNPGQTGYATVSFAVTANRAPVLSNARVTPASGATATTFEFLVDYYDPDGNPPYSGFPKVYLSNGANAQMTLKSGSAANGTYHYSTTLSAGSYTYFFSAADTLGGSMQTGWYSGPSVYSTGNATIDIVIQCTRISSDLHLKYSTTSSSGPWTDIPITKAILDPLVVPAQSTVYFQASVASANYEYRGWEGRENGVLFGGSSASAWSVTLGSSTTEIGINVFYGYTPQYYSIAGTVTLNGGGTVSGGVDLILSSSEQTITNHTDNGSWSFSSILGGVSVTVTPQANGYTFSPASLVFNNLSANKTGQAITAYSSDDYVPTTQFTTLPPNVTTNAAVAFAWSGQDNVSLPANLVYQYKLDCVNADWSAFASATSANYSLSNGCYTFWLRAKDQAGNTNQAPSSYTFVVNAAPKVLAAVRNARSVWASRVTVQMPNGAPNPSNKLILLPQHSGMTDSDLVPVRIHRADQVTPSGANAIIASQVGLPASITKTNIGWLVTLPDSLSAGQTASYDVVWGKAEYFGWRENVNIPRNLPNGGQVVSSFLNDDYRLWRLAVKNIQYGGNIGECKSWVFMNVSDGGGTVVPETIARHQYGQPFNGSLGYNLTWNYGQIIKTDARLCLYWLDNKDAWDGSKNYYYKRFGGQFFDLGGAAKNTYDSTYVDRNYISLPSTAIRNRVWLMGERNGVHSSDPVYAWFQVLDSYGNEFLPSTDIDSIQNSNFADIFSPQCAQLGTNTLLLWQRYYDTSLGRGREQMSYQVRNDSGQLVKSTSSFTPLLDDSQNKTDTYEPYTILTDNDGKVWISYFHHRTSQTDEQLYIIIGTDGNVWKGPVQTSSARYFNFCDKDGLIWTTENGQLFALNSNDTTNVPSRTQTWIPNQKCGAISASVNADGYRLYDRWSPQVAEVDVPLAATPTSMEVYDLNLWSNDLHTANFTVQNGSTTVWSQSGQFTGDVAVAVVGKFNEGQNILTLTQNDFLGGQVLITFPYAFNHVITAAGDANVAVAPAGNVVVTNGANAPFNFTPAQYYHIANVEVDAASVGTNSSYTLLNVTQDHTLQVYSAANVATNNVPHWWLASYGWTNNFDQVALSDPDGDGMTVWQEYHAGTDPTNAASKFGMNTAQAVPGGFVITWSTVPGKTYKVLYADSPGGPWQEDLPSSQVTAGPGETGMSYTDTTVGAAGKRFYRVRVVVP